jgi:adenylate cyclase
MASKLLETRAVAGAEIERKFLVSGQGWKQAGRGRRFRVSYAEHVWEVDEFHGANAGLVVAEIELQSTDKSFERPDWLGREVSDDPRYFNANLIAHPYRDWKE